MLSVRIEQICGYNIRVTEVDGTKLYHKRDILLMVGYKESTSLSDMESIHIAGFTDKKNLVSFLKKRSRSRDIAIRKTKALDEIFGNSEVPDIGIIKTRFGNISYEERKGKNVYRVADICRIIGKSGDIYKAFKTNNQGYAEEEVVFKVLNAKTKGFNAHIRYEKRQAVLQAILNARGVVEKSECKCWWCRLLRGLMHRRESL